MIKLSLLTMLRRKIKGLVFYKKVCVFLEHYLLFLIFNFKRIIEMKNKKKLYRIIDL